MAFCSLVPPNEQNAKLIQGFGDGYVTYFWNFGTL